MAATIITLSPIDDVAIARFTLPEGSTLHDAENLRTLAEIPGGHKVAVKDILLGEPVHKYGQIIGFATQNISAGEHVHVHNLAMGDDFSRDYAFGEGSKPVKACDETLTFNGFLRPNGQVATRNLIGIVSTVNCSATTVRKIAEHFSRSGVLDQYPNVEGVIPVTHGFGCCIDTKGEGIQQLRRTVGGYVVHPNFAAVLVVGLGCEANQMDAIFLTEGIRPDARLIPLVMQEEGGTHKTVEAGIAAIEKILPEINRARRQPLPISHLVLALQCGGSDGYSGITANPALGHAVDLLVAHGGSAILTETPEIYGAEHLLTRRAARREIGEKLVTTIQWWERYAERENGSIDNNPTPGNKSGGLTTILEKSLGAVAKSGSTPLQGVYNYAEPIDAHGLLFMDAPGYDPMGATGQIASGATILAFTTGRGSCFGSRVCPTIKIATNSGMFLRMQDDMDINCGSILDGASTVQEMGEEIFRTILKVASGEQSKSESLNVGNEEMVPWMIGAQM